MKIPLLAFLLLGLALVAPAPVRAQDDQEVSFDYFHDSLAPYGEWIQAGDYGLCWHPAGVSEDWAPYTDGYWSYTDGGWTWVSYEDFGGITYHYGRWVTVPEEGWCWVPDYQWGPAWVSWRNNDDYVGWAPLPPEVRYTPDVGVSTWVDTSYDIGPGYYHFCRVRDFGAPVLTEVIVPRARNVVIIGSTFNVTNITVSPFGFPFVGGPRIDFISAHVLRPVPTLKLVQVTNVNNVFVNRGGRRTVIVSQQRGNTLVVPALRVRPPTAAVLATFKPAKVVAVHTGAPHGWDMVKDHAEAERLHATFREQVKGATPATAPARAFQPAEIKAVPTKADPKAVVTARPRAVEPGRATEPGRNIEPGRPVEPGRTVEQGRTPQPGRGLEPARGLEPSKGVEPGRTMTGPGEKRGGFGAPEAQPGVPRTAGQGEPTGEKHGGFVTPGNTIPRQPGTVNVEDAQRAAREHSLQMRQQQDRETAAAQAERARTGGASGPEGGIPGREGNPANPGRAAEAARSRELQPREANPAQPREINPGATEATRAREAEQSRQANQARAMEAQRRNQEEQAARQTEQRRSQQEQMQRQQQARPQGGGSSGGGNRPLSKEEQEALKKQRGQ